VDVARRHRLVPSGAPGRDAGQRRAQQQPAQQAEAASGLTAAGEDDAGPPAILALRENFKLGGRSVLHGCLLA
jgi:hypothetical protein